MRIPEGWHRAPLGDVCRVVSGATPSTSVPSYWGGGVKWVTPNDMSKDRSQYIDGGERCLTADGFASCSAQVFPEGSVIVSSRAPIGYVAIAADEMCTNQGCKTAVPPPYIDSRYLYWFLLNARSDLEARASGTTFKEISAKRFAETQLWWPSPEEQRRIVAILEEHLSDLANASASLRATGIRLGALERSWLRNELATLTGETRSIGSVLYEARGGWSRSAHHLVGASQGVPYLKMNNITADGALNLAGLVFVTPQSDSEAKYGVRSGDLLFNSKNSAELVGKTALADKRVEGALLNENIMRLRFTPVVDPTFAWVWFQGPMMKAEIAVATRASTNVAAIYQHRLVEMTIRVPSTGRQAEIAAGFVSLRDSTTRARSSIEAGLARGDGLRRAVLAAAFSGRLTGHGTDTELIEELAEEESA